MKLIGALLIILSATIVGFRVANMYVRRTQEIRRLIVGLQMLETEICMAATPLEVACERVSMRLDGTVSYVFQMIAVALAERAGLSTYDCWKYALRQSWRKTMLKPPEEEIMMHIGHVLGRSDKDDQRKHLRLAIIHLQSEEEKAREDQQRYERMYRSLGFLCGILTVILLY